MKEKELRLALVCYGGISLAVYMHGVTKEVLKLVRASKAWHKLPSLEERARHSYAELALTEGRELDTEPVYFEFLKALGERLDLRVIVDAIAGASAGGINGIVLARALAHDLPIVTLREAWLTAADVDELLAGNRKARPWSKWYLRPLVWAYFTRRIGRGAEAAEMRSKFSTFLRSKWFRVPFDGKKLAGVLYDAIDGMGDPPGEGESLLPVGQQLELFVTLTDFFGYSQTIRIHDPARISEREHRHILRFAYQRWPGGEQESDFTREGVPALIFAARATSSFPGAFPPMQLKEIDAMLADRGRTWSARDRFVQRNFRTYHAAGLDPDRTAFLDGSVLNNKPFGEAIAALRNRPAFREVDRRLVYIDPDPEGSPPPPTGRLPGFFESLRGAISDLPRNEPIRDELQWVEGFNERVRRLKIIVEATRPHVRELVADIARDAFAGEPSTATVRTARRAANTRAAREAGFAYEGYLRLKIGAVLEHYTRLLGDACGLRASAPERAWLAAVMRAWAQARDIYPADEASLAAIEASAAEQPPWVGFLLDFDVSYRQRRLFFVIQRLNELYTRLDEAEFDGVTAERLDDFKTDFYRSLEVIRHYDRPDFLSKETADAARALFRAGAEAKLADAPAFARDRGEEVDALVGRLAAETDLRGFNREVDAIFAEMPRRGLADAARRELLVHYLGFAFWDVLTFSVTHWRDLGEFDEIRIDRISPEDATAIRTGGTAATLKGVEFGHFGAFFSRPHRENDYLWGRLHAVDRLFDILYSTAALEAVGAAIDVDALKREAFRAVLRSERSKLLRSTALIDSLLTEVGKK